MLSSNPLQKQEYDTGQPYPEDVQNIRDCQMSVLPNFSLNYSHYVAAKVKKSTN